MILLLVIISVILFALLSNFFPNKKFFIIISIIAVLFCYFLLEKNFFRSEYFFPSSKINTYFLCGNYYNLIVDAIKSKKLYLTTSQAYPKLETGNIYKNFPNIFFSDNKYRCLLDTSYYNGKIYLYFGITPILLFYLPFNLITNLYLTDKILGFVLACFIFLLSLFLTKKLIDNLNFSNQTPTAISILSIFFIGMCNYLPFLLIRTSIYEIAIMTANLLLLLSFLLLYFYLETKKHILILLLSFCLSLSVGARPYYVLHIPMFFTLIIFLKYKQTKDIKEIIKTATFFIVPCLLYGTIVALYNYLRFDSIFEFGIKYQLNDKNLYTTVSNIKDLFLALNYNLFQFPEVNTTTFFQLIKANGHSIGNELVSGIIWTFPLIFLFIFIPKFLIDNFKQNKNIFYIVVLIAITIFINLIITNLMGIIVRFIFEYMSFIVILSIILFFYLYRKEKTTQFKLLLNIFFIVIFCYSIFMNFCLLFCENNASYYAPTSSNNYLKAIDFLFK